MTPKYKTLISSTVLVLASVTAFSALARTPPAPAAPAAGARVHGKAFKELDTNNDKMISRDEVKAKPRLTRNFDVIDTNENGQLSRDEMKAYRKTHKGEVKGQPRS